MTDLFRDDDVFIGVGVGRKELSVDEVRGIFHELYPRSSDYAELLVRKWMRTRGRNVRPAMRHAGRKDALPLAVRKDAMPAELTQKPPGGGEGTFEPAAAAVGPGDEALPEVVADAVPELEEKESETSRLKPVAVDAAAKSLPAPEVDVVVCESRLIDGSQTRLTQSVVRTTRVVQPTDRRGSETRHHGRSTLPPIASQPIHDADHPAVLPQPTRSKPHQRGRRHIRLPPLHDTSTAAATETPPSRSPAKKRNSVSRFDVALWRRCNTGRAGNLFCVCIIEA